MPIPGFNGLPHGGLSERVRALEVVTVEHHNAADLWMERVDDRLRDGSLKMDELSESALRAELAIKPLEGMPHQVAEIKAQVSLLPSLMAKITSSEERWAWIKGRVYYVLASGLLWLVMTGRMSFPELLVLLEKASSLLGPLLR